MRQLVLFIAFAIASISAALAQDQPSTFVFEGNNFSWTQTTNGSLFYNESEGLPGLEVPVGESNQTIFGSTLWIGGLAQSGDLRISYRKFCQNENENCVENWGPLKMDGSLASAEEIEDYNHVWFVTKEETELHQAYFNCLEDPACDQNDAFPNYEIPDDFLTWPAQSEEGSGFAEYLAPFVDRNGDEIYSTEDGDFPAFCGDFASYCIWNGTGTAAEDGEGSNISAEIHTQIYGFIDGVEATFNTLFLNQKIINRGSEELTNTYLGLWTDFDIGNPQDDYVATDVQRSMFYGYNGSPFDGSSSSGPGYGSDVPAMGVKILAGPFKDANGIDDSPAYEANYANETIGFNDAVVDNERLGLFGSMFYNDAGNHFATGNPTTGSEHYNYMRSIWRDGTPMSYTGIGYNPTDVDQSLANYVFPGASDPLMAGTNGIDPNYLAEGGWTEENEGNAPSDRRMIGSSGPFTFSPGDVQYIDLAYIFARESFDEQETVIETLQRFADEVEGMQCQPLPAIVLSADKGQERKPLQVYPNPSSESISFELNEAPAQLTLVDITGKVVLQQNLNSGVQRVDVSSLSDGIYLIQVKSEKSIYHGKMIIEK